jgi:PPK2 family polyphosphate:nucleotide phosphotransferase
LHGPGWHGYDVAAEGTMQVERRLRLRPGRAVRLSRIDTDSTLGIAGKEQAAAELPAMLHELRLWQYRLYAENRRALLVILQGMDAAGKDGVVRGVFSGLNPQGCRVSSFKVPSSLERQHDFLWRIHQAVPGYGEFGVFNRSHYEDVLVVRVHGLAPRHVWKRRYAMINAFETYLTDNGVEIVKFFLHVSRREQAERLFSRLDDPERNWKFSSADIEERSRWDDYQDAYEEALTRCTTEHAPWYAIPADHKWYRDWAVAAVLLAVLRRMAPRFPPPLADVASLRRRLQRQERGRS